MAITETPEHVSQTSGSDDFGVQWEELKGDYARGDVEIEEKDAAQSIHELTFRDIAFKD